MEPDEIVCDIAAIIELIETYDIAQDEIVSALEDLVIKIKLGSPRHAAQVLHPKKNMH